MIERANASAGVLTDPVQRRVGLHRRRLLRLIDTLGRQVCGGDPDASFTVRDHYVVHLLGLFEVLASVYGLARS